MKILLHDNTTDTDYVLQFREDCSWILSALDEIEVLLNRLSIDLK